MASYSTVRKIHARFPAQDTVLLCKKILFTLTKSSPFSTKICGLLANFLFTNERYQNHGHKILNIVSLKVPGAYLYYTQFSPP